MVCGNTRFFKSLTTAEGTDGRGEAERPTAERESDLTSNGREEDRANEGEGGASDGSGASDVKDEEMAETDRASLLRVTATGSENGTGVGNESSPPWTEEPQARRGHAAARAAAVASTRRSMKG